MLYLNEFRLPTRQQEETFFNSSEPKVKRTCYTSKYPFGIFRYREMVPFEFEQITILYPNFLILTPTGTPYSEEHISMRFKKIAKNLGLPQIRFHDLRHTAATNMYQLTGDFYTVGEILGHSLKGIGNQLNLSGNFEAVTERYIDVRLEHKRSVLDTYHKEIAKDVPQKEKKPIHKGMER